MTDKNGRNIDIIFIDEPISVIAKEGDIFAGSFDFETLGSGVVKIKWMNMEEDYLRCGIGVAMVIEALNHIGAFDLPKPVSQKTSPDDGDWISTEADDFFQYCASKGYFMLNNRTVTL